jgi:chondroitin 4-sulfotransferase 11
MKILNKLLWACMSPSERAVLLNLFPLERRSDLRRLFSGMTLDYPKSFDNHKCIFIHIPKNAGTSVRSNLKLDSNLGHQPLSWYENLDNDKYKSYFKFCFVRNPWDRLVSAYFYLKEKQSSRRSSIAARDLTNHFQSFDDFVIHWINDENIYKEKVFFPQHYFMKNQMGILSMDFVGRVENINSDIETIMNAIGMSNQSKLSNINKSKRDSYKNYYSIKSRKIVETIYSEDIKLFDYKF